MSRTHMSSSFTQGDDILVITTWLASDKFFTLGSLVDPLSRVLDQHKALSALQGYEAAYDRDARSLPYLRRKFMFRIFFPCEGIHQTLAYVREIVDMIPDESSPTTVVQSEKNAEIQKVTGQTPEVEYLRGWRLASLSL